MMVVLTELPLFELFVMVIVTRFVFAVALAFFCFLDRMALTIPAMIIARMTKGTAMIIVNSSNMFYYICIAKIKKYDNKIANING